MKQEMVAFSFQNDPQDRTFLSEEIKFGQKTALERGQNLGSFILLLTLVFFILLGSIRRLSYNK